MSADLNHIEHVWDVMGRRIRNLKRPPMNLQELEAALHRIWWKIHQAVIRSFINMRERLQEVIRKRGGNIRF